MNIITDQILHISSNCYYIEVQEKVINIGYWRGDSFSTKNRTKNRNPNEYFTSKLIKIVVCYLMCKIYLVSATVIVSR